MKTEIIELLLRALTEMYALDGTAPGLVFSYLPDKKAYYGSICRYEGFASPTHPPDRKIMKSVVEPDLDSVVRELVALWDKHTPATQTMIRNLKQPRTKQHGTKINKAAKARRAKLRRTKSKARRTGKSNRTQRP